MLDKNPEDKVFGFSVEPINYVDFIGVDAFSSNYSNQRCDEIYLAEKTFLLKTEGVVASSFGDSHGMCEGQGTRKTWQTYMAR